MDFATAVKRGKKKVVVIIIKLFFMNYTVPQKRTILS